MEFEELITDSVPLLFFLLGVVICCLKSEIQSQNIFFGFFLFTVSISSLAEDYGYIIEDAFLFSPLFLTLYINKVYQIKTSRYYYLFFLPGVCFYDWSYNLYSYDRFNYKSVVVLSFYIVSIILLIRKLYEHKKFINRVKLNFSEITNSFQWINPIIILSSIWCLYPTIFIINDFIFFLESRWYYSTLINGQYIVLFVLFFYTLFIGFGTSTFINSIVFIDYNNTSTILNDVKENDAYKSQSFSQMRKEIIENKLYLDPKLSLFKLSKELNLEASSISELIKTQSNDNFYSFINKMRIREFKYLIGKNEHLKYNLDSVASFSGFNSKSTFYRAFKELEGITPSEFISKNSPKDF